MAPGPSLKQKIKQKLLKPKYTPHTDDEALHLCTPARTGSADIVLDAASSKASSRPASTEPVSADSHAYHDITASLLGAADTAAAGSSDQGVAAAAAKPARTKGGAFKGCLPLGKPGDTAAAAGSTDPGAAAAAAKPPRTKGGAFKGCLPFGNPPLPPASIEGLSTNQGVAAAAAKPARTKGGAFKGCLSFGKPPLAPTPNEGLPTAFNNRQSILTRLSKAARKPALPEEAKGKVKPPPKATPVKTKVGTGGIVCLSVKKPSLRDYHSASTRHKQGSIITCGLLAVGTE
jgi:hypothetical protein